MTGSGLHGIFGDGAPDVDERYWATQLAGDFHVVGVPPDHLRPDTGLRTSDFAEKMLEEQMRRKAYDVCTGKPALMFALFVAALKVCLHKYSGAEEIVIGIEPHWEVSWEPTGHGMIPLRSQVRGRSLV